MSLVAEYAGVSEWYSLIFKTARVAHVFGSFSWDIICSSKLSFLIAVPYSGQIMSVDNYLSMFSRQMEAIFD